jgi:hypothetical protein
VKTLRIIAVIAALIIMGRLGLNYIFYGHITRPTTADFEAIAKSGQKIAQAISDYRSDHGLLPEKLDDLVPKYLEASPVTGWRFDYGSLTHYAGEARTEVIHSFAETNGWQVIGEAENQKLNVSGPITKLPVLTGEALFAARLTEYERRISHHVGEKEWYESKINFLGLAKREDLLRNECARDAKLFPNWWLPQLALAELNVTSNEAEQNFKAWVQERPTFVNYWYLSRFYRDKGDANSALAAVEQASECAFQAYPSDARWVGAGFAFDAAKFCCENRKYELTLKLVRHCEHPEGSWEAESLLAFQAAAELGLGQFDSAIAHAQRMADLGSRQAIWAQNLPQLLQAARTHDTNFLYRTDNACGFDWSAFDEPQP